MSADRDAIRARLAAATPGPWTDLAEVYPSPDADLIAHAPTDLAALLADVDAAEAEVARIAAERDRLREGIEALLAPWVPGWSSPRFVTAPQLRALLDAEGDA